MFFQVLPDSSNAIAVEFSRGAIASGAEIFKPTDHMRMVMGISHVYLYIYNKYVFIYSISV